MNKKIIALLISILCLLAVLASTTPNNARLPLYLIIFSLVYVVSFFVIILFLDLAYTSISASERRFIAIVLGFSPTIIIALASLSSVSVIDIALAVGVPVLVIWYTLRRGVIK
jgi:hypothetical protein